MSRYARGTEVPADRSVAEIKRELARYGASEFHYAEKADQAAIGFVVNGRAVRMRIGLPDPDTFKKTARGRPRAFEAARREWEAACRQSWRCLLLVVRAKLEAIESGIATFEDEWLAYLVVEGGETIGERVRPRLDEIRKTGVMPLMLGMEPPRSEG